MEVSGFGEGGEDGVEGEDVGVGGGVEGKEGVRGVVGLGVGFDEAIEEEGVGREEWGFEDVGMEGFGGKGELVGDAELEEGGDFLGGSGGELGHRAQTFKILVGFGSLL